jgi:ribosomal-protein-alanine N-acetyltransferase
VADEPFQLPVLSGSRLQLRAWRRSDSPTIQEASRDPLIPLITTVPTTDGEVEAITFIARQHDRLRSRSGYVFAMADAHDRAVGHIGLFPVAGVGARASVGYWVAPSERRKGYAAEALGILTTWARGLDDFDRLELYVEPWNTGSWRAAENVGYEREGLLSAWKRIDGKPKDMYIYVTLTSSALASRSS